MLSTKSRNGIRWNPQGRDKVREGSRSTDPLVDPAILNLITQKVVTASRRHIGDLLREIAVIRRNCGTDHNDQSHMQRTDTI